jgi:hypothetical protein
MLVWDPVCLAHNTLSVLVGLYALLAWKRVDLSDTCSSLSDAEVLVMLLQAVHSASDFIVFYPQMLAEPILCWHHSILIVVATILPRCQGCFYLVAAFSIAEFGSGSITAELEYRKYGGKSSGLSRVVVFGVSRVFNLALLYKILLVTPTVHEFILTDSGDGTLVFKTNVPVCLLTSVGGSAMMLLLNGITWHRMFRSYLKQRNTQFGAQHCLTKAATAA